jgi:hypothetical protein
MGNIEPESGFNPFLHERGGGGGWGIIQWTPFGSDTCPFCRDVDFDIGDGTTNRPSTVTNGARSGDNDLYLLWQLHALWKRPFREGRPHLWAAMNAETSVGNFINNIPAGSSAGGTQFVSNPADSRNSVYAGKGSAYLYHAVSVRSGDVDWGWNTAENRPNRNQQGRGNIRNRPWHAQRLLDQLGATGPGCVEESNNNQSNNNNNQNNNNENQNNNQDNNGWNISAQAIVDAFNQQVRDGGSGCWTLPGNRGGGTYCIGSNGCTTMSAWFVDVYTNLTYGHGHGVAVARQLANRNSNAVLTNFPTAPAVFSSSGGYWNSSSSGRWVSYGHTGIVVSVEGNTATTVEVIGLGGTPRAIIAQHTIPRDSSKVNFVNLGSFLK